MLFLAVALLAASILPAAQFIGISYADNDDRDRGRDRDRDHDNDRDDDERDRDRDNDHDHDDDDNDNDDNDDNDNNDDPEGLVIEASRDTYLRKAASNTNEGANDILRLTHLGSNRALVAFDLSEIEGDEVESATLQLYIVRNENDWKEVGKIAKTFRHQTISVHQLTQYWEEGNGSDDLTDNKRGDGPGATWQCAVDAEIKNRKPDCEDKWHGGTFERSSTDEISIQNWITRGWIEFDVTEDVNKFLSGEETNYGWLVKKDHENLHGAVRFASSETDKGPRLVVTGETGNTNSPPSANDDSVSTGHDTQVTFNVLSNDSDPDGDALTAAIATNPSHGSIVLESDGSATYTPSAGYSGSDSFTYVADDGSETDTATVTITVTEEPNRNPVAVDDSASTSEGDPVTIDVLDNDSDGDGGSLSVISASDPPHGTAVINGDDSITYTPDASYSGTDSFNYVIEDGQGGSDSATVTVGISMVNEPPLANGDSSITDEDTTVTIDVLSNDSDPDGDALSISSVSTPAHGGASIVPGGVDYAPDAQSLQDGQMLIDTFTYTVSDGNVDDTATVTVTINGLNDAPTANNGIIITDEEELAEYTLTGSDPDTGDMLAFEIETPPQFGELTVEPDGTLDYSPIENFFGSDSFVFSVTDSSGSSDTGTVSVTVNPLNDPPEAEQDAAPTTPPALPVIIAVLENDFDADGDDLEVTDVEDPEHGTAIINGDNTITFIPDLGFIGPETFMYTISDGNGGVDSAQIIVTISLGIIDANDDDVDTEIDEDLEIEVLANDLGFVEDPGMSNGDRIAIFDNPSHGTATINIDGTITYVPTEGFEGVDEFVYAIYLPDFTDFDSATVTVTVGNP